MARYECSVCAFVYDEQEQAKRWSELPEDWTCPVCGAGKPQFRRVSEEAEPEPPDAKKPRPRTSPHRIFGDVSRTFVTAHRLFGYVYLGIYLYFIWQMAPRLWQYQIELPARTVVHLTLGMAIGAMLLAKIAIVRFFRRLEAALVPLLGTSLLVATVVLIGISAPLAFQEALMRQGPTAGALFSEENLARVRALLLQAGLEDEAQRTRLASPDALRAGRDVLRTDCIECHDLRTVLARPRTPKSWRDTVGRMADRTTLLNPIGQTEQWQVTAYLIAISPELQRSAQQMRAQQEAGEQSRQAAETVAAAKAEIPPYDPQLAKRLFETKCSQCHRTTLVESSPPGSAEDARSLITRMVGEGLSATEDELAQIVQYLVAVHVEQTKE